MLLRRPPVVDPAAAQGRKNPRRFFRWLPGARQGSEAEPTEDLVTWDAVTPSTPRALKRNGLLDRLGWYEIPDETILTTTRQVAALNPALVRANHVFGGLPIGLDADTGLPWGSDPFVLYPDIIQSLNAVIVGDVGVAKSTLVKDHYCSHQLTLGRQVAVFDRKSQEQDNGVAEGEYGRLARLIERAGQRVARIKFSRSGDGACVNILDPRITRKSDAVSATVGQDELLHMVAVMAHGPLTSKERKCLDAAHAQALRVAAGEGRTAILSDVVECLYRPDDDAVPGPLRGRNLVTTDDLTIWGLELAFDLSRFIEGDLSGLINGETRSADGGPLDLDADLLIIDTSALLEGTPAMMMMMAIMATFLASVWTANRRQSVLVVEEGYSAEFPDVAKVLRSLAKRGRGIGLLVVFVLHHLSDIDPSSPLAALFREAGVVHLFRQDKREDAAASVAMFGLGDDLIEKVMTLPKGSHVLKEGADPGRPPRQITHVQTALETWVTYTDHAITGGVNAPTDPFAGDTDSGGFHPTPDQQGVRS